MSENEENDPNIIEQDVTPESEEIQNPTSFTDFATFGNGIVLNTEVNISDKNTSAMIGVNKEFIHTDNSQLSASTSATLENGEVHYTAQVAGSKDFNNGVSANAEVNHSDTDTSLSFGMRRHYINMDNIDNTQDQYQERKEELQETGDHFSLQSKVGYSKEQQSFYTENSLMYRIDDNNFLTGTYTKAKDSETAALVADLKNVKLDYGFNNTSEQTQHLFNFENKNQKLRYTGNLSLNSISQENAPNLHNVTFGAGMKYNKGTDGEMLPGFSGSIDTAMTLSQHNVSGYRVDLDGEYNKYGNPDNSDFTDCLTRLQVGFGKEGSNNSFETSLSNAYRINQERTVFETRLGYQYNEQDGMSQGIFSQRLGVYQQLGKNYGDASIYAVGEHSFINTKNDGVFSKSNSVNFLAGGKIKATKKLAFGAEAGYNTSTKWNGNVNMTYNF